MCFISRNWWLIICLPVALSAQKLNFGVVAGTSVTGDFETGSYRFPGTTLPDGQIYSSTWAVFPGSRSLIIGPKLELKLPLNFTLEVDALHRALHSKQSITENLSGGSQYSLGSFTQTHASWEFPILAKYRFSRLRLDPFLEAGPSLRPAGTGTNVGHWGATAGAGITLHAHNFNISPGFRFTHWKEWPGTQSVPVAINNQVEFLVGFDRTTSSEAWATGFGGRLSAGVLVGVGLGNDLQGGNPSFDYSVGVRSDSNSPIAGLMLEVAVYRNWSIEANGIYRPLHATTAQTPEGHVRFAVLTWEFPVMAKYKFGSSRALRPFVEIGPSFRLDGNYNGPLPAHYGVSGGVGVETRLRKLKISPAVRYTRWGKERSPKGGGIARNEVEALVAGARHRSGDQAARRASQ